MYCKKCGRQLDDGVRFCDRCGQSVRQSQNSGKEARRKELKELKEERLNRKQKLIEKEQQKQLHKENKKNNLKRTRLLALIFILLLFFLIIFVTYKVIVEQSENAPWRTTDGSVQLNATEEPDSTTVPSSSPNSSVATLPTATAYAITGEANSDGYKEFNCSGIAVFPYPAVFMQQNSAGNAKLSLYDQTGGGAITLYEEGPVSLAARELMSQYAKEQTGKVSYSRAGDDWYIVETVNNDLVTHRKCLIINNIAVFYDFTYSTDSVSATSYKEQIQYMDEHFSL